jgi:Flp pilus assembly protein TadG
VAILKKLKRLSTNSEGVVAIIVALVILAFVGITALVVDMGSLYQDRGSLQNVADAAALAGAQELPLSPSNATQEAADYVTKNRVDIDSPNILISSTLAPYDTITVTINNPDSPIRFGSIYGSGSANVSAVAKAIVGKPQTFTGVVPWGVIEFPWVPGTEYPLDEGKFGPLSFNGESTGGSVYRDNIANGYSGPLEIGDEVQIDFLHGFKSGPTKQGTESRVGPASLLDDFFDDLTEPLAGGGYGLKEFDSQFVMCPIVSQETADEGEGPIIGFAPFVITDYDGKTVKGRFLSEALIVYSGSILPVDDTGIKVIRLIQ